MQEHRLNYKPSLAPVIIEERLSLLLLAGRIIDETLNHRTFKLERSFRRYAELFPHGMWAPGLIITPEMTNYSELFFPIADIQPVFRQFFAKALFFPPFFGASVLHNAVSWPDALHKLEAAVKTANPAQLLQILLTDELERRRFLFLNFLPNQYGGTFDRYPKQMDFLSQWLLKNRQIFKGKLSCLDAACGCGEGTYGLAKLLVDCGFSAGTFEVCGTTIEPLELFAAAHCFFPHDSQRQQEYRHRVKPLFEGRITDWINFCQEDITGTVGKVGEYHVILCNGIIGGPFLYERETLDLAVAGLAGRLKPGGVLVAADKFHDGWKKRVPETLLCELMTKSGLSVEIVEEGLVGFKT